SSVAVPATTIPDLVEAAVARTPEAPALIVGDQSISYREMNERANRLAHHLICLGIDPESLVGIALERSAETIVCVMAALKAGAAYLPVDPEYPEARIAHILNDAVPAVLLTTSSLSTHLPQVAGVKVIAVDAAAVKSMLLQQSGQNPARNLLPGHPAYVIYTSGSTGTPKGVVVTHAGIPSLVYTQGKLARVSDASRVLQFASLNFDASLWEIVMALTSGAALVLVRDERGGAPLHDLLLKHKVTHATLPLGVLATLEEHGDIPVECLMNGGEALPGEVVARWSEGRRMINAYGPTETTVCATMTRTLSGSATPPIGSPIANTRVYVLDENLEPVPHNVAGELYVSGASLARGYLKQPGLTAERFVADPYSQEPGTRMYRTGDLVRWRADGTLDYIGRADGQIKIRGFRIETGEIEAALREQSGITQAAVIASEDESGNKKLVAYITPNGTRPNEEHIRANLRKRLPDFMIPAAFVVLEHLPLTPNGKLDRRALPAPEKLVREYHQPVTPEEELLCAIFAELLSLEQVSVDDDFFSLGGHSLMAMRIVSRVRSALGVEIAVRDVFTARTARELAATILAFQFAANGSHSSSVWIGNEFEEEEI
ncbi:MAG TPA: amino acid adenylation domain-containing protein, partial [Candidatus Angelobacter sp.]|nr:amino acid adenylation domain-containing protein [Candidatus Angelobacter sp.]